MSICSIFLWKKLFSRKNNQVNFFQDPRFNRQIDGKTGYKTDSLVCMPVCNYDGEVIGVAQIINKRGGEDNLFTEQDLKVLL